MDVHILPIPSHSAILQNFVVMTPRTTPLSEFFVQTHVVLWVVFWSSLRCAQFYLFLALKC